MDLRVKTGPKLAAIGFSLAISYPFFNMALHPVFRNDDQRPERTVIVTGASGNLGTSITYQLARRKVRVIMACRDMEKCRMVRREIVLMTGNKSVVCRHLDLEDIDSINRFADEMIKTEPHIDVLVNNAAVKHVPEMQLTKYGVEKNYFVNFLAPFLLTFRLTDKLKESAKITNDSRIINITGRKWKSIDLGQANLENADFAKSKYDPQKAYKQSKLALAYFSQLLDKHMQENRHGIYVYAIDIPHKHIYKSLYYPVGMKELVAAYWNGFYQHNPDRLIQSVIKAALDPKSRDSKLTAGYGAWSFFGLPFKWGSPANDEMAAKHVWNGAARFYHRYIDSPTTNATPTSESSVQKDDQPQAISAISDQEQKKSP